MPTFRESPTRQHLLDKATTDRGRTRQNASHLDNAVPAGHNFRDLTESDSEDVSPSKSVVAEKQSVIDLTLSDDDRPPIYFYKAKLQRASTSTMKGSLSGKSNQLQKKATGKLSRISFVDVSELIIPRPKIPIPRPPSRDPDHCLRASRPGYFHLSRPDYQKTVPNSLGFTTQGPPQHKGRRRTRARSQPYSFGIVGEVASEGFRDLYIYYKERHGLEACYEGEKYGNSWKVRIACCVF